MRNKEIANKFRDKKRQVEARMEARKERGPYYEPIRFQSDEEEMLWLEAKQGQAQILVGKINQSMSKLEDYLQKMERKTNTLSPGPLGKLADMGVSRKAYQEEVLANQDLNKFYNSIADHLHYRNFVLEAPLEVEDRTIVGGSEKLSRPKTQLQIKQQYLDLLGHRDRVNRIKREMRLHEQQLKAKKKEEEIISTFDSIQSSLEQ